MTLSKAVLKEKDRIKRIRWLVEEFLEVKWTVETYEKNAGMIRSHSAGLEWSLKGVLASYTSNVYSIPKLLMHGSFLGNIWNFMKQEITAHRNREKIRTLIRGAPSCISQEDKNMFSAFHGPATALQSAEKFVPPDGNNIFMLSFKDGQVGFEKDRLEIVSKFMDLFEGVDLDLFKICEAPECDRWFVTTYSGTKRRRRACNNQHAARLYQAKKSEKRKLDPKEARKYRHQRNEWRQERKKRKEAEEL